jgi:hypothetical protein
MEEIRMSVEGSISVAVDFNDTASDEGLEVLKKIRLSSNTAVTSGKIAIASGTVSTTVIEYGPPEGGGFLGGYRDASGDLVSFDTITGFALQSDGKTSASQPAAASHFVVSDNDEVAFTRVQLSDVSENFRVQKLSAGTCNFSLVIYGT